MTYSTVLFLDWLSCALLASAAAFRGGRHGLPFTGALILGLACALFSLGVRSLIVSFGASLMPDMASAEQGYMAASFLGACTGYLLQRLVSEKSLIFPLLEGVSLALATVLGTYVALTLGLAGPFRGVTAGCIAGVAGGMLRDLCLTERPALLEADFYGGAVVVGAMAVTGMHVLGVGFWAQIAVGCVCVCVLRLFGCRRMKRRGVFSEF